jgi:tetratricopeptide (TPR) repeat protein
MSHNTRSELVRLANTVNNLDQFGIIIKNLSEKIPIDQRRDYIDSLGIFYYQNGYFRHALKAFELSLSLSTSPSQQMGNLIDIGKTYNKLEFYTDAISYYEKALKIAIDSGAKDSEAGCYINIGVVYRKMGGYEEAISYYEKALKIAIDIDDKYVESLCYKNLGNGYSDLGNKQTAQFYYEKATRLRNESGIQHEEFRFKK